MQVTLNLALLRREFRVRLPHAPAMTQVQAVAADIVVVRCEGLRLEAPNAVRHSQIREKR